MPLERNCSEACLNESHTLMKSLVMVPKYLPSNSGSLFMVILKGNKRYKIFFLCIE